MGSSFTVRTCANWQQVEQAALQIATTSVNAAGLVLRYYGKLDPKTSTGYTTETPKTSVSGYSTKTPKTSTGYTTKTA